MINIRNPSRTAFRLWNIRLIQTDSKRAAQKKQQQQPPQSPQKTALYQLHQSHMGRMIEFANYLLPIQYMDQSIQQSHQHTRRAASIFDVSHMLQTDIRGRDAIECIESITTADLQKLPNGMSTLTVCTNSSGGILDDLIITKCNDQHLYIVSNASRRHIVGELMTAAQRQFVEMHKKDVQIKFIANDERSLIAIQGPAAAEILQTYCSDDVSLQSIYFMQSLEMNVANIKGCRLTRCGYTGEDGFELSIPSNETSQFVELLLKKHENCKLAGLAVRDSLRIEAGLCLYGQDINEQITPIEAGLTWTIAKRRRIERNFPGANVICDQITNGTEQYRYGFKMISSNGPSARQQTKIYEQNEMTECGSITSGCPSITLGGNIAMGYINSPKRLENGTIVKLLIRNRFYEAIITKMPFVQTSYYTLKKQQSIK